MNNEPGPNFVAPSMALEPPVRPTWHEWGIEIARAVSTRADCVRSKVGAVIITADHRIVATGYNGAPAGDPGCLTAGACPRGRSGALPGVSSYEDGETRCIAPHAEKNAMLRASWADMEGSTMYVTREPCYMCKIDIKGSPLVAVFWPGGEWRLS